jgi:hypothetical protein
MGTFLRKPAQGHVFHNVFHICGNLGGQTEAAFATFPEKSAREFSTERPLPAVRSFDSPGTAD